jgi:hypothetical protein
MLIANRPAAISPAGIGPPIGGDCGEMFVDVAHIKSCVLEEMHDSWLLECILSRGSEVAEM